MTSESAATRKFVDLGEVVYLMKELPSGIRIIDTVVPYDRDLLEIAEVLESLTVLDFMAAAVESRRKKSDGLAAMRESAYELLRGGNASDDSIDYLNDIFGASIFEFDGERRLLIEKGALRDLSEAESYDGPRLVEGVSLDILKQALHIVR